MPGVIDELSPLDGYGVGSERIALSLADPLTPARAFSACTITIGYAACDPEGVTPPIRYTVTGPGDEIVLDEIADVARADLTFRPISGGRHLVRVAELAHNRWLGRLAIDVEGDAFVP